MNELTLFALLKKGIKEVSDKISEIEGNAFSGSYNDLTDKPDLSNYVDKDSVKDVSDSVDELKQTIEDFVAASDLEATDEDINEIIKEATKNVTTIQANTDGFDRSVAEMDRAINERQAEYLEALHSEHSLTSSFTE